MELVRAEEPLKAIAYARQHLARWAESHEAEHQRACALLAFRCDHRTCRRCQKTAERER